jgi:citronellol/citronellal dehydrogenase
MSLAGKTLFITGASRGIGLSIGLRAARDGANIAIAAKSTEPHPQLPGTIYSAAEEIEKAGGRALPLACDIRQDEQVANAVTKTVETFGGIDICVNNASAISLTGTLQTDMKRWDLMQAINNRGAFLVSKLCLPHLLKSPQAHILMISPPLGLERDWFAPHVAYTIAKTSMSLVALGLSGEFQGKVAVNCLWPRTTIATSAIRNIVGGNAMLLRSRKPEIMADASYAIFRKDVSFTGNFLIDDSFLASEGETDFDKYRVDPSKPLQPDFFVPASSTPPASLGAAT